MADKDDELLKQLEEELASLEKLEPSSNNYGSPTAQEKDNMFKFFKEIINLDKSWKVGNLKDEEIGKQWLSVRSNLDLARYAEAEGLDLVKQYFLDQANIVSEPTMGRKGFMSQLFVTNIRKQQTLATPQPAKKSWFGGNKTVDQGE